MLIVCRARTYFDLGLNIGRLLSLVSGVAVLRATAQLLAEFDYYCSKDGSIQDLVRPQTVCFSRKMTIRCVTVRRNSWCPEQSLDTIPTHSRMCLTVNRCDPSFTNTTAASFTSTSRFLQLCVPR